MADINADISQWSTTAASNAPADSTNVGSGLGDNLRTLQATVRAYLSHYNSVAIVSGATTDLGANSGLVQEVSGVAAITSLGTVSAGIWKIVRFQGAATLTHAASLVLPGAANIVTAAGDHMLAYSRGSGNWTVPLYQRADGSPPAFITGFTAETSPAKGDLAAIYDLTATAPRKMTLENLLKVVNDLTNKAAPVANADYLLAYDTAGAASAKVLFSDFASTAAEIVTGTDVTKFMAPGNFAANSTVASAGHFILPGGIQINWGTGAYADPVTGFVFEEEFPTACWACITGYSSGNSGHAGTRLTALAKTGFNVVINPGTGGAGTIYYIAIGN